ncbi:MAG: DUF58 domain-containing protein [Planctomycetes bacterium]|nr:DUF58 domain-containing protein [Planctomycetota bacterium]
MFPDRRSRDFLEPDVIARLAHIPLHARRPMLGSIAGRHASPHRGASVEFAEYRKYVPGDDLRRLDWRAYGRSDRFYVKEFEADTNLRCCLVIDASGSMNFGAPPAAKIDYARKIAATIAYLAVQQGDAVGLSQIAQDGVRTIPPRRNPAHLMLLFDTLEALRPAGEAQLIAALHEIAETVRQRALIIVISDFFADPNALRGCFEHFRFRRHDVALFHLLDPLELRFDLARPFRFLDLEGGPSVFAEPAEIAERYRAALDSYLAGLRKAVLETAIDYQRVLMSEPYDQVLLRFLIGRARGHANR